jgi:hypothetical protein
MDEAAVLNYEIIERRLELDCLRDQIRELAERARMLREEIRARARKLSYTRRTRSRRS